MYDEASNSFVPVKITVKEFSNEENKRIYSVEAIDIETQKKPAGQLVSDSKKNGITPITDFDANIQQLIELAKNTSKVVDENGEPKVVYHQTNSTIYRNVETGENWDDLDWREKQEWEERDDWDDYWQEEDFYTFNRNNARTTVEFDGFFFAPEYDEYHGYGKRTIEAFLNIRKPASQEDYNIDSQYNDAGRKEHIRLQENGYDGVIHQVEVYYCPVNIDGTQFSARLLVKRYENNGRVIEHLQLYDLSAKQKKSDAENSQMGQPALTSTIASDLRYKVKDLIHTSQVQDKELLGITSDTLYRSDDIAFSIGSFVFQFCRKCF